ncbi:MAG: isopeptide-forming domain-containing fimbrial protein [Bacilli bacterium]|nr:isopeptide-forming domain-containing fimbrial protein [Bacilli bacterium]
MKKILKFSLFAFVLTFGMIFSANALEAETLTNKLIDAKYSWTPDISKATVTTFGETSKINTHLQAGDYNRDYYLLDVTNNAAKTNTSGVLLKNVGKYNGKKVDMKITFASWKYFTTGTSYPSQVGISIKKNDEKMGYPTLNFERSGYATSVTYKIEYLVSGTSTKIKIGGNYTIYDNDIHSLEEGNNRIEYVIPGTGFDHAYKSSNSECAHYAHNFDTNLGNNSYTCNTADNLAGDMSKKPEHLLTLTYEANTLNITYGYYNKSYATNPNIVTTDDPKTTIGHPSGCGFMGGIPVEKFDYSTPSKLVNEKTSDEITENSEFTYSIEQFLPTQENINTLTSLVFKDILEDCLTIEGTSKIKVFDQNDTNVTNMFTPQINAQTITLTLKDSYINQKSTFGKTYTVQLTVKLKSGYDMSKYIDGDNYVIPNTASTIINGQEKSTNKVTVHYPVPAKETQKNDTPQIVSVPSTAATISLIIVGVAVVLIIVGLGTMFYVTNKKSKK